MSLSHDCWAPLASTFPDHTPASALPLLDRFATIHPVNTDATPRNQFASLVLERVRALRPDFSLRYDPAAFAFHTADSVVSLENVFLEFTSSSPDSNQRGPILENFLQTLLARTGEAAKAGFQNVRGRIFPVIRERTSMPFAELQMKIEGRAVSSGQLALQPISAWFGVGMVIDHPSHVESVTLNNLEQWGVDFNEAMRFAMANLVALGELRFVPISQGTFVLQTEDVYGSSRLIFSRALSQLSIQGDPVVVIPNRHTIFVTGANNPAGIQQILDAGEKLCNEQPRPANFSPLVVQEGVFYDFELPDNSPAFQSVERARILTAARYYGMQGDLLKKYFENQGSNLLVAKFHAASNRDGRFTCYSMWLAGMPSLLPRADRIVLFDPSRPEAQQVLANPRWEAVRRDLTQHLAPTDLFPARFVAKSFPSEEEIQRMT